MNTILTIEMPLAQSKINIEYFDTDTELMIWMEQETKYASRNISMYFSPNQINSIITHLAKQLELIGEPIDLLTK